MERDDLELALIELDRLIADEREEQSFQGWLATRPHIFRGLGYSDFIAHPVLKDDANKELIPDFMAQRTDGLWEIIELKRPDTPILKSPEKRSHFYAHMQEYISQCREYSEYFDDAANRSSFKQRYGKDIQKRPPAIVVAGRNDGLEVFKVHGLLAGITPAIRHQTYDTFSNSLHLSRFNTFGAGENSEGLTIYIRVCVLSRNRDSNPYILDFGVNLDRDRLTIRVPNGKDLLVEIRDSQGQEHDLPIASGDRTFQWDVPFYLGVQVATSGTRSMVLIDLSGSTHSEYRSQGFRLDPSVLYSMVVGADLNGHGESSMDVFQIIGYDRTLSFQEKVGMREFLSQTQPGPARLQFVGHKFSYSAGHARLGSPNAAALTDLVQTEDSKRPIFRNTW
jgi:hypothetical protein